VKEQIVYCGVDVAKAYLDAAIGKQKRRLPNDAMGHRQLINWIKQIEAQVQVICEPSGGYERMLIQALVGAQVKVSLVQANRVRQFARAAAFWPRPIQSTQRCYAPLAKPCGHKSPPHRRCNRSSCANWRVSAGI
jgi:hypothetical protein